MVKIDFEFETEFGVFRDAICLPDDHAWTEEQINAEKQQRLDNWLAIVTPKPPVDEVPAEQSV